MPEEAHDPDSTAAGAGLNAPPEGGLVRVIQLRGKNADHAGSRVLFHHEATFQKASLGLWRTSKRSGQSFLPFTEKSRARYGRPQYPRKSRR